MVNILVGVGMAATNSPIVLVFKAPVQVAHAAIVSDLLSTAIIVVNILSLIFDSKNSIVFLLEILLII